MQVREGYGKMLECSSLFESSKKYQKKFIKEETLIMYGILFILPMTYMISTLGRFYVYDGISILIIAFIIGYFILNLLISMYISYKVTNQFFRGV